MQRINVAIYNNCSGMIHFISEDVIIKIIDKFTKCRKQILITNTIINIDKYL